MLGEYCMSLLTPHTSNNDDAMSRSSHFCADFCLDNGLPKYILGRNIYAASVAKYVKVDGFIDDFTSEVKYLNVPVVKLGSVPNNALVLNVAGGRPLTAMRRLDELSLRNLDYFSFYKLSGLTLVEMRFNEGFEEEFNLNEDNYEWAYRLLNDELSREIFKKLVNFRYDYDINHLDGFTWREDVQYFEDFLCLRKEGETFIDIGGYNGFTSLEFIKRCPRYKSIHIFEPEPDNYRACIDSLQGYQNIHCHKLGLSSKKSTLKLDVLGSGSKISDSGTVTIEVDTLDDVLHDAPTFIKMDIEGEEVAAIEGARNTILQHHPRLAISVYHGAGDFWRIPKLILSTRDDYEVYMRHYTECIYETVMFFIPKY